MSPHKIDFESLPWEIPMKGVRAKRFVHEGKQVRLVGAAMRIGKVGVDHGETGCKTPDAIEHIERVKARRKTKGR